MNNLSNILGGPLLGIGITAVVLVVMAVVFLKMFRPMMKDAKGMMADAQNMMQAETAAANLRMTGLPGQARVLNIQPTGTMVNMAPQCRVDLEVEPPATAPGYRSPPYRVSILQTLNQVVLPRVQPGMTVPVKIDASNPTNVVVDA